jgi:hypothetical protein
MDTLDRLATIRTRRGRFTVRSASMIPAVMRYAAALDDRPLTLRARGAQFTVRSTSMVPSVLRYIAALESRECGANADGGGGFQPGNTCGKGDGSGGGGDSSGAFSASGGRAKELTADIRDGGEVTIPDDLDRQHVDSFNWDAAERYSAEGGEGAKELIDYTTSQLKFNNYFRYGEHLSLPRDAPVDQQMAAWKQKFPDGHPSQIPVWDKVAYETLQEMGLSHDVWASRERKVKELLNKASESSGTKIEFDPTKKYTHDLSKADDKTVYVPVKYSYDLDPINNLAKNRKEMQETYGVKSPADLAAKIEGELAKNAKHTTPNAKYIPGKSDFTDNPTYYLNNDANNNDIPETVPKGAAMAAENAIKAVAAKANPKGEKVVTWRGVIAPPPSFADEDADARSYLVQLGRSKPGDVLKEAGIFSSSASPAAAAGFTSDNGVLLRVVGKSGAPLEKISANKNEHEVAYPDSSQFTVRKVARGVTVKAGKWHRKNVTVIDIEEN